MADELSAGSAYVELEPSAKGWKGKVEAQTKGTTITQDVTPKVDSAALAKARTQMQAAADKVADARRKEADAAGQVRVAELKLEEIRNKGNANASQVAAAEEKVAAARRKSEAAAEALSKAEATQRSATARVERLEIRADTSQADKATESWVARTKTHLAAAGSAVGAFATKYRAEAATVLVVGGAIAYSFVQVAADAEQSMGAVDSVFKGSSAQVKAWADGAAQNLGMSAHAYREAAALIGSQLKNMGVPMDQVADKTNGLITMAADLASMFGGTTQQAVEALSSALRGEMDPIERYGITLNQAAIDAKIAALGLDTSTEAAKRNSRAVAIMALVQEQGADSVGNFAREHDTAANAAQRAQAEWDNLRATLGEALLPVMSGVGNFLGGTLIPLIRDNTGLITGLALVVGGLAAAVLIVNGAMAAYSAAQAIATAATWLWNSALLANPITWVVVAIVALVAAVIYAWNHFEWFRTAVLAVWQFLQQMASWLAGAFVAAWNAVVAAAQWVGSIFTWLWQNAIAPAFSGIASAAQWLWGNVLQPVFGFIGAAFEFMGKLIAAIVVGVILVAWDALKAAAQFLWANVLQPIFGLISAGWRAVGDGLRWVYDNVILPVWSALQAAATWLWQNVLSPVFAAIASGWRAVGDGVSWVWQNVIAPAWRAVETAANWLWSNVLSPVFSAISTGWSALGSGLRWVYDTLIKPVIDAFVAAASWLRDRWNDIVAGIRTAWDAVREAFAAPIRFVVNTVWNDGIGGLWDRARSILPLGEFPRVQLGFAAGGVVPGGYSPGRDSILAMLSPGEGILRPEVVRGMGRRWLDQLNQVAAAGGPDAVRRYAAFGGEGPQQFAAGGVAEGQAWARSQAGKPYIWGGVGPNGYDCSGFMSALTNFLQGITPLYQRRFTTASFSAGRGVGGFVPGLSSAFTIGVSANTGGGIGHMAGTLGGLNVESRGGDGVVVGPGARGADNSLFPWKFSLPEAGGGFVSGGGGGGNVIVRTLREQMQDIYDSVAGTITDGVRAVWPGNGTLTGDLPVKFTESLLGKTRDFLFGRAEELDASAGTYAAGTVAEAGPVQEQVRAIAARYGWNQGPEWDAIVRLVQKESSWNPAAANPTSTARGLFQQMESLYGPAAPTPGGQAAWGLDYIRGRYGTPTRALAFHNANGWYDSGGVASGRGIMLKEVIAPERVLSPRQTEAFERLIPLLDRMTVAGAPVDYSRLVEADTGRRGPAVQVGEQHFHDGVDVDQFLDKVEFETAGGRL